ncbi:energy transducer TonB [Hyphomicrobium sp. LHD-15]|uniref:energy transducer TonB n=1 Tax=Hyphomicrobium sp. LHD-15 TaxID=3072142 RepID=UPI00280F69F3|nr:energy transducer TonB [Hyphomicrobium sp. LHD-15]MDQ8700604.1 energy transducer TonB [Hyphomicrobium sp. LHD-15]
MIAHLEPFEVSRSRHSRWLVASVMMISMHAAAGALAYVEWSDEVTSDETEGAYMVEYAPETVSPPIEMLNLAIGPRADEAAAAVAATEEEVQKSEIETPKVPEAPLAPQPEVVVKNSEPVEETEEKKAEENPLPKQVAAPTASSAAQEASAPPPVEAPEAEKPAAAKQGLSSKPSQATLTWQKAVALHLNKHKKYPSDARSRGEQGVALVSYSIDRSGKVVAARLDRSSGSALLDQAALDALNSASPFPAPPTDVIDVTFKFAQPIQFRIKR